MAIKRITTNLIKDSDIATVDIANNAITAAKITDGNITTAKLADLNVTAGKLAGTLDLTGKTITVATATTGDSDTSPASTAFVQQEIAALVDSSPSSLNTLNELAAALGDDASFSTTVTNSIATKLPLAGGTMTGNITLGDNNKVIFGTGSDLEIYHDGSSDVIKNATGNQIYMQSTGFNLSNSSGLKHIYANNDYGVTLFYQNNGKLETVSGGIDVTGYMDADNFKIAGAQGSDGQVLTSTGSGVAWEDAGGGSTADADGDTQIQVEESSDEDKIRFDTAGTERLVLDNNGHLLPGANNTYDLGATATRWRNIYTNDLQLSNEQGDANEIDGTQGSWTIQEGDSDLFLINRKSGKKYKFDITEIED